MQVRLTFVLLFRDFLICKSLVVSMWRYIKTKQKKKILNIIECVEKQTICEGKSHEEH